MTVRKKKVSRNFDLFDWAEKRERRRAIRYPAAWLRRRHPLSEERAALVADLAGLGGDR